MTDRALRLQAAWAALVFVAWIALVGTLRVDPDYTAGELLDNLLAWGERGTPYVDPAIAPHRVLNYPPTFLAAVRGLTWLGLPPLVAGRLLGTAGVLLLLAVAHRWMRADGASRAVAAGVTGLAAGSFAMVYSSGQFHLEGLASAATIAGFLLLRDTRGWRAPAAGAALAFACLVKQPQVVLSLVGLAFALRARRADAPRVVAAYAVVGLLGCGAITLAFGGEAWRHMLTYTVGTYSLPNLAKQVASHALPLAIFAAVAFRRALASPGRGSDPRWWLLVGSTVWLFSAARVGSSYPYFMDWQVAVLLWVADALRDGSRLPAFARRALAAQALAANVAVVGVLGVVAADTARVSRALPALCAHVTPALTVSESPAIVRACGAMPVLQPFIMANLNAMGLWDDRRFVTALELGGYPTLLLPFDPAAGASGVQAERWTPASVAAMAARYAVVDTVAGWRVLVPRR